MRKQLEQFYSTFGDRGVMFIMFALSVVLNAALTVGTNLPDVLPEEIGAAGIAVYFSGGDWSALMSTLGNYCGYVQSLLYAPLFIVFKSPYALYKGMLMINDIIASFIPLIVYHLASKLGVERVWMKITVALFCGMYVTYVAHTQFIWNETVCSVMPWLLVLCLFNSWDKKNRYSRFAMSMLAGFLCAVSFAGHQRLLVLGLATAFTVLIARLCFREKILNIPVFFVSAGVSFLAEYVLRSMIQQSVWRGNITSGTISAALDKLAARGGFSGTVGSVVGHTYGFMTSTMGFGALAAVFLVMMVISWCKEDRANVGETLDDGTRVYTPTAHKYSLRLLVFGFYAFFVVAGSLLVTSLGCLGEDGSISLSGLFIDSVAPLAVFFALTFIFLYGISLRKVFWGLGVYAAVFVLFNLLTLPRLGIVAADMSELLSLQPWRIGEDIAGAMTSQSFVIMSSCVFTMFALLIVFTSCSRRHREEMLSVVLCGVTVYTTAFASATYIPLRVEENIKSTAPITAVSNMLYNDPQSPLIAVYRTDPRVAEIIQFLNPETNVTIITRTDYAPDSCLLIAENGVEVPFAGSSYDVVGRSENYSIYAYGQTARDFIKYKSKVGEEAAAT